MSPYFEALVAETGRVGRQADATVSDADAAASGGSFTGEPESVVQLSGTPARL